MRPYTTEKLRSYKLPRTTRQTQQPRPLGKAATAQRRGTLQTDSSRIISNFLEIRPRCGPSAVAVALPAFLLGTLCSEYKASWKKTTWHRIHVSKKNMCSEIGLICFCKKKRLMDLGSQKKINAESGLPQVCHQTRYAHCHSHSHCGHFPACRSTRISKHLSALMRIKASKPAPHGCLQNKNLATHKKADKADKSDV